MEVTSRKELFKNIERIQPDVIIVDDGYLESNLAALLKFLRNYPQSRMIIMSVKTNLIQIYETKQIQIKQVSDFLAVL